tara:strand:- start:118 stop:1092 length:975 start_codon:yes stop_codon:yes gene_type:complete
MNILITGAAGFIGSKLCSELLKNNKNKVYAVDNLNPYYSIKLKKLRIKELNKNKNFKFLKIDLKNNSEFKKINQIDKIDIVYHFAAQAGVRYTLSDPKKYFDDNIKVFFNLLNFIKNKKIKKLFFASSSSVYGDQKSYPINEKANLYEKNFYGFSKKINEYTAKVFSKIYGVQIIGLRFFTVFGEWGRPDMLIFKYLKANFTNKKFFLNENGRHLRDFTYIEDVIKILIKIKNTKFTDKFLVLNICSNKPIKIISVINRMNKIDKKFKYTAQSSKELKKIEVNITHGDNTKIKKILKSFKFTKFEVALSKTINWYVKNKIYKIT